MTDVHVADGAAVAAGQLLFTVEQDYPEKSVEILAPEAGDLSEIALVKGQSLPSAPRWRPSRLPATTCLRQLYRRVGASTDATVTITGGPALFGRTGVRVQVSTEGTASVRCSIPTDQVVFAGLLAQMDLALGQVDDALIVPITAVQGDLGTGNVWVDAGDGSDAVERAVTLGVNDGAMVEVVEEGEMIRQFVPGFLAPVEEFCYEVAPGVEQCESGTSWLRWSLWKTSPRACSSRTTPGSRSSAASLWRSARAITSRSSGAPDPASPRC
ncbi:efflux RND transporter periplasmic adaptor subunit [Microbacterium sp. AK031]|uniref:efflux RND transporter periplasmic adaptor subunit n=1 Tax=Microbacterium sp. AK031 TaxID=2723076 RepID=UPI0021697176|nr:efflux RND transporter periplasmic adaptor subunit [Microbacterium sp. AK031]MCS3842131.1 hypothetical protein [Microbacterium sp. AK031]